jgi:hypothetical protein
MLNLKYVLTTLQTTGDPAEPFWTAAFFPDGNAELVVESQQHIGLGFTGFWGADLGVSSPQGNTARERAEVWFDKV